MSSDTPTDLTRGPEVKETEGTQATTDPPKVIKVWKKIANEDFIATREFVDSRFESVKKIISGHRQTT